MTILQALDNYYHRLKGVAEPGWAPVKFGWCIVIDRDGNVVDVEDLRDLSGKKPKLKNYVVPMLESVADRTSGVAPNFLSDKTAYVLGRTVKEGKRTVQEHAAFVGMHLERLADQSDEGLAALRQFVEKWTPDRFDSAPFRPEMVDANIMFRVEGDQNYLHERTAARVLAEENEAGGVGESAICLVTGDRGPIALKHPKIKGVETDSPPPGGGFKLVSFNLDEPPRDCRRPFGLSYAAMGVASSMA